MTDPSSAPAGWYLDGQDPRRRYWDGSHWTGHFEVAPESVPTNPKSEQAASSKREMVKLPADQLTAILNAEVASWTAKGWTLEAKMNVIPRGAMLREPRWKAFVRDLLLVFITFGLWLIYVMYRRLVGKTTSKIITVDRFGRVKTLRRTDKLFGE